MKFSEMLRNPRSRKVWELQLCPILKHSPLSAFAKIHRAEFNRHSGKHDLPFSSIILEKQNKTKHKTHLQQSALIVR